MKFGREKRMLLAWMALLAPIPLPFNQVLEWPFLFGYGLLVIYFIQRTEAGQISQLPNWVLNVMGALYVPIFILDVRWSFYRGSPVKALLHLVLFLIVVKLYSMRREGEKWQVILAIFFVFVGAMATSSHVTIGIYLLAFMAFQFYALTRLSHLHLIGRFGRGETTTPERAAFRGPVAIGTLVLLVVGVAIPLFAAVPRVREPFLLGRGGTGIGRTTGFSDSVNLNLTTSIRGNRNVALRIQFEDSVASGENLRFKGAAYDRYENRRWFRETRQYTALRRDEIGEWSLPWLETPEVASRATIYLEPISSQSILVPSETVSVELPPTIRELGADLGGALILPQPRRDTIRYEVSLASAPVIAARLDERPGSSRSALDGGGLTPRMVELAREFAGEGTAEERTDRIEQVLLTEYGYTDSFVDRDGFEPLEDFLFEFKTGHCELFASAMVLLLRAEGIPARLVTGFLGAEYNPLEDYYIVRQSNAHAWVEAFTPERGWQVYDPTPPEGRPAIAPRSLRLFFTQLADYVTFRWDRYVLTYGADDQGRFFQSMRERLATLWSDLRDWVDGAEEGPTPPSAAGDMIAVDAEGHRPAWQPRRSHLLLMSGIFAILVAAMLWFRRPPTGEEAYRRLRRLLDRQGVVVEDSTAPREVQALAHERLETAEPAVDRVIDLYLRESFAEEPLPKAERRQLAEALATLRSTARRRKIPADQQRAA